jgi:prephenate dehydratase
MNFWCSSPLAGWSKSRARCADFSSDAGNSKHVAAWYSPATIELIHSETVSMRIAIQGEVGSFSHEAAGQMAPGAKVVSCSVSREVFEALRTRKVDAAVIPIENTLAGPVGEHLDLLLSSGFFAQREHYLRIRHNLIAAPGLKLADIRRVYSHPVALDQCRELFRQHSAMRAQAFYDTAGSVKHVIGEGLKDCAAIAGAHAAKEYGGKILLKGIEDNKQNFTRFFYIVGGSKVRKPKPAAGANKTSIAFALRNLPGALFKALSVFALRDIDLTKIESRPMPGRPWEYVFFVDYMRGDDDVTRRALEHLREFAEFVSVLGIYPEACLPSVG